MAIDDTDTIVKILGSVTFYKSFQPIERNSSRFLAHSSSLAIIAAAYEKEVGRNGFKIGHT